MTATRTIYQLFLKQHREEENVSAPEMAKRLGVTREHVYRIETSQRSSAMWQARYAKVLKISPLALWEPPGAIGVQVTNGTHFQLYLREHRKANGVSVPVMARRLGTSRSNVYRIERSQKTSAIYQVAYAEALEIAPSKFWMCPTRCPSCGRHLEGHRGND
jgi:transcriptional regulator with XRE-family HTH domain